MPYAKSIMVRLPYQQFNAWTEVLDIANSRTKLMISKFDDQINILLMFTF